MAEMLLVSAALAAALLLPVIGDRSIASILLASMLAYLRAQTYLVSIL